MRIGTSFLLILISSTVLVVELHETLRNTIPDIVKCLKDANGNVRQSAIEGLLALVKHGKF